MENDIKPDPEIFVVMRKLGEMLKQYSWFQFMGTRLEDHKRVIYIHAHLPKRGDKFPKQAWFDALAPQFKVVVRRMGKLVALETPTRKM